MLRLVSFVLALSMGTTPALAAAKLDLFCKNHSARYLTDHGTRVVGKETATDTFPSRFVLTGNVLTFKYPANQNGPGGIEWKFTVLSDDAKHFGAQDGGPHKVIVAATKGPQYRSLTATRLRFSEWHITIVHSAIIFGRPVTMASWYKCDALTDKM